MKIGLFQYDMAWEDKESNKRKILSLMEACPRRRQAGWVVFPEMTLSGFSMDQVKTTLAADDKSFFADLARDHSVCVSYGGVEEGFNKLITLDASGRQVSEYSKIHLFSFNGEDKDYKAGARQETFELGGMSVSPAVCFDLRFPYLFWRLAEKTDVFVLIACWPLRRAEHWMTLLRARAIENQAYVVGVNRIGREPGGLEYGGNSMVFDPMGMVVLDCGSLEGLHVCEADIGKDEVRAARARLPFFKDRKE
ncbi:MAG: carbon-nitrogen family hydrolase [Elusimicrobia bacterium]|nr:carbon-nitrogen family hydrolase [Elusimicrobiota bacterium]